MNTPSVQNPGLSITELGVRLAFVKRVRAFYFAEMTSNPITIGKPSLGVIARSVEFATG